MATPFDTTHIRDAALLPVIWIVETAAAVLSVISMMGLL
uniref:Putative membrane protein n=1 Tax=Rhizobium rhizogenes TaxID=359 RepID=A0A7S5DQJ5_RHIRH|nr:putative membrane protein [Rhizobium rhizogenes]